MWPCNPCLVFALIDKCAMCIAQSDPSPHYILSSEFCGLPQLSLHSLFTLFHGCRGSYLIASRLNDLIMHVTLGRQLDTMKTFFQVFMNDDWWWTARKMLAAFKSGLSVSSLNLIRLGNYLVHFYHGFDSCVFSPPSKPTIMSLYPCNLVITRLQGNTVRPPPSLSSNLRTVIVTMMTIMYSCITSTALRNCRPVCIIKPSRNSMKHSIASTYTSPHYHLLAWYCENPLHCRKHLKYPSTCITFNSQAE